MHLWQHVHHAEHGHQRHHPRGRVLAVPPVLHRQAEDPRHRRSRRPVREALRRRAAGREEEVASPQRRPPHPSMGGRPALFMCPVMCPVMVQPREVSVFEAVDALVTEHAELEQRLADPTIHADQGLAKRLNQRYAELSAIVRTYDDWRRLGDDIEAARELATEDPAFGEEAIDLEQRRATAEERLRHLLVPRDPTDSKDALLEIKSGEGGEESALFAGDLLRMYTRYAERRGWKTEQLDATESDLGGFKSVTVAVKAKGTPEPGEAPYALLKFEGGVHRVQRVPVTESQGRVHTSAAGVLVMPEAEQVDVSIEEKDLRIDVFRSSGPGGQSVNTTDSAVRITHVPTGIVASCQNEKSQLQNREQAMRILRARLLQVAQDTADAEASDARRLQVRTVDRSERIRTYNFPENRISDHRTGYKSYNLDHVLDGDLDAVIETCVQADLATRLDALESGS